MKRASKAPKAERRPRKEEHKRLEEKVAEASPNQAGIQVTDAYPAKEVRIALVHDLSVKYSYQIYKPCGMIKDACVRQPE